MKITLEQVLADAPEIAAALRAEGTAAGATAERERIQSVFAQSMAGHEALIQSLAFDGKTTGPEAAVAVLNAERTLRGKALGDRQAEAPKPVAHAAAESDKAPASVDAGLPVEERCKAVWDKDANIRDEFACYADYLAFVKAEASGRARVLRAVK